MNSDDYLQDAKDELDRARDESGVLWAQAHALVSIAESLHAIASTNDHGVRCSDCGHLWTAHVNGRDCEAIVTAYINGEPTRAVCACKEARP